MKILYLTNHHQSLDVLNDYMSDLLLHGLREIHGNNVIDYPPLWYLYKDESQKRNLKDNKLWGKGFTTKNSLNNFNDLDRTDIKNKIINKYFDLIIYSSIRRSHEFIEDVIKYDNKFIFIDGEDDQFIDEKFSNLGIYFKRELVNKKDRIYPINFAIPENKILSNINLNPNHILAPLIPGRKKTYIYQNEIEYYKMYQSSIFALSYKKAGWDCLRHYEILMNGCIPLFLDLEKCPDFTLTNLPKKILIQALNQYKNILDYQFPTKILKKNKLTLNSFIGYFSNLFSEQRNIDNFINVNYDIFTLKKKLLSFTRSNLTTKELAKYVLNKIS